MIALGARLVDRIGGGLTSCSHGCPRGSMANGYVVTEGCCCNFSQTPYVTKRNASSQQQVPCRGASSSRLAPGKDPRQICCHGSS